MNIYHRQARPEDVSQAVPLMLQAAQNLLVNIFGNGDPAVVINYLSEAWCRGAGQYGCDNHYLACTHRDASEQVVGLITGWHDGLPEHFDGQTLMSITEHFGLEESVEILMRSRLYTAELMAPATTELALGHLAVDPSVRRQGVGTGLVTYMAGRARQLGKSVLALDVESENEPGLAFYRSLGFSHTHSHGGFVHMLRPLI